MQYTYIANQDATDTVDYFVVPSSPGIKVMIGQVAELTENDLIALRDRFVLVEGNKTRDRTQNGNRVPFNVAVTDSTTVLVIPASTARKSVTIQALGVDIFIGKSDVSSVENCEYSIASMGSINLVDDKADFYARAVAGDGRICGVEIRHG